MTVGTEVTYAISLTNLGPDPAMAVAVTAPLPSSLAYTSSSSGCTYSATGSRVSCSLGKRDPNSTKSVEIKAIVVKPGNISMTAKAESQTFDPDTSDNTATAMVSGDCPDIPLPGDGQIAFQAGWAIIGVPDGTRVPSDSRQYGWFDRNDGGFYSRTQPNEPLTGGHGYWARFSCPRLVNVAEGTTTASFAIGAYKASLIGNPSGTQPVTVTGHGYAAQYDKNLNGGAGGYHYSGYKEPIALAPGEGAWVFSYEDSEIRMQP